MYNLGESVIQWDSSRGEKVSKRRSKCGRRCPADSPEAGSLVRD